ncbi:MAG: hypothetical protein GF353_01770 [Candidatus Lokiarchaeota archaeon]|nr:hypothetical protein [Candidatus Lokiarchaeota archaeon]
MTVCRPQKGASMVQAFQKAALAGLPGCLTSKYFKPKCHERTGSCFRRIRWII